jgi:hypothetical protein
MRGVLTLADFLITGYLIFVLLRIPEGWVPHVYLWYFGGAFARALVLWIAALRWTPADPAYESIYKFTLVPVLALSAAIAMRAVSDSPLLILLASALAAALDLYLRGWTFPGLWPAEASVLIVSATLLLTSLAHDRGSAENLLALYTGLLWLVRGFLLVGLLVGARRYAAVTARHYPWVFALASLVLTLGLALSLRSESSPHAIATGALTLAPTGAAPEYSGAVRADLPHRQPRSPQ